MSSNEIDYDKLLYEAKKDTRVYKGYSPASAEINGKVVTGLERNRPGHKPGWATPEVVDGILGNDPLVKRTPRARVLSLAKRLWEGAESDPVARGILEKGLSHQRPLCFEDVRELAVELIKKAELEQEAGR